MVHVLVLSFLVQEAQQNFFQFFQVEFEGNYSIYIEYDPIPNDASLSTLEPKTNLRQIDDN